MSTQMKAMLFCLHCSMETEHTITYVGNVIKSIKCEECGTEIELKREALVKDYTSDFIDRIMTKPTRMTEELEKDLTGFLCSMPIRILTKPYRVLKEVREVLKDDKEDEE